MTITSKPTPLNKVRALMRHSVAKNAIALYLIQAMKILAPFLILPYLSRVFTKEEFGIYMVVLSLSAIGLIITDFGFNLSATYEVAKHRDNKKYINKLLGSVIVIKICLLLFCCIGLVTYSAYFPDVIPPALVIFICLNVFSQSFLFSWFFQGIEKMKEITFFVVVSRVLYLVLTILIIDSQSKISDLIALLAISNLIGSILSLVLVYKYGYRVSFCSLKETVFHFKNSFQFFISRAAVGLYTSSSTFIIGAFAGVTQAAVYGACEKVYQGSLSLTQPISQALFPFVARTKSVRSLSLVIMIIGLPVALFCILVSLYANQIMGIVFGDAYSNSGTVLQVFLAITSINFISLIMGYPAFSAINRVYIANYTVMFGALLHVGFLAYIYSFKEMSAFNVAFAVLLTETIVMLLRVSIFFIYKKEANNELN